MGNKGVPPLDLVYSTKKNPQRIKPNDPQGCHESKDPSPSDYWLKSGVVLKDLLDASASDVNLNDTIQDVSAGDGNWQFDNFSDCLPNGVVNEIAGYHSACPELGNDRLIWNESHDGSFSVKSAYSVIRDFSNINVGSNRRNLWHWRGPTRAKHFLWLTIKGGLKTKCFLWEHGLITSSLCPLCGLHDESSQHNMRDCPKVQEVWNLLLKPSRFGPSRSESIVDWIFSNISSKGTSNGGLPWHLLFGVTCWCIWKYRNAVVFSDETWDPNKIVSTSMHLACEFVSCCQRVILPNRPMTPYTAPVRWLPPRDGWVKWNVDGSVVGRHQQASSGCVPRDSSGRWLYGLVRNIGSSSISCAELASKFLIFTGRGIVWLTLLPSLGITLPGVSMSFLILHLLFPVVY
ncbi:Reverse transcriptase zinc-binding domain [Sesbania bispinosa]|nr:Reverse transcriptase zinc-binding domain [Sesbania bispinosa]